MSEEMKKKQKQIVDEMMKVYETNPDLINYMEALMKFCIDLLQKVEQLENIRKKAIEYIKSYKNDYAPYELSDYNVREILNILNKGSEE